MKGKSKNRPEQLGVDIGGVIISRADDRGDTSFFSGNFLDTLAEPSAFDALARLRRERFGVAIHLVSKCGPKVESKTRQWLAHWDFFGVTGIPEANLHFCRARQDKGPICEKLGVTHFIDDRQDVLANLVTVEHRLLYESTHFFSGPTVNHGPFTAVRGWRGVLPHLTADRDGS